jgi:uncharacterized protein (TIGR04255 family)
MGKQWKNPPVYFVIAQVRFNPVLSVGSYIAKIQEDFRKADFPDFKKGFNIVFNPNVLTGFKAGEEMPIQQTERYVFSNTDGMDVFILDQNGLTLHTTAYKTFSVLMEAFLSRLEYLRTTLGLSFSDRIGLRYLDAVMPTSKDKLRDYLIPEAFGLQDKVKGTTQHSFTESMIEVSGAKLLSRVVIQNGPVGVPPDLQSMNGKLAPRFATYQGEYAIIDTDCFIDVRGGIDRATIQKKFHELHEHVDAAFYATITEHAVATWS